jgi:sugar lactone lactonase YvrE
MTHFNLRACLLAVASLAFSSAQVFAQATSAVFAGLGEFTNAPATAVPINPRDFAIGPDGLVYVADQRRGRVIRFDPATDTATSMFHSGGRNGALKGITFDNAGNFILSANGMYRRNLVTGQTTALGGTDPSSIGGNSTYVAVDPAGSIYMAVEYGFQIHQSADGFVSRFAGSQLEGFSGDGGPARGARIDQPQAMVFDGAGNLFFADQFNGRLRRVAAGGSNIITTVAGTGLSTNNGDGLPALSTNIASPTGIAFDPAGNLVFSEPGRIRRIDAATGLVTTLAGQVTQGFLGDGGPAVAARFSDIRAIRFDAAGNLYVADWGNNRLRRVDAATGIVTTVLGNGTQDWCGDEGPALDSCLHTPYGVAIDVNDNVFLSDPGSGRIRRVEADTGLITTIAGTGPPYVYGGDGGAAVSAGFGGFAGLRGIAFDPAGNLVIAAGDGHRIRRIDMTTGIITTIAGTGIAGYSGDNGNAQFAQFFAPNDVAFDAQGNLFVADYGNNRVRRIDAVTNVVTTFAGNGALTGFHGDGGHSLAATIGNPNSLEFDAAGNLLIGDRIGYRVRKVNMTTRVITTLAGNGTFASDTDGPATSVGIGSPSGIAVDAAGNIFVNAAQRLRRIDASGHMTNLVGMGGYFGEGLEFDSAGRLLITESAAADVRRVSGIPGTVLDSTPPIIESSVAGAQGDNGWYTTNVSVSWNVSDPDSTISSSSGCGATSVTEDTTGTTFTCSATSLGGSASNSVTIRRDGSVPLVIFGIPLPGPAVPGSGWYNADQSVPFDVEDSISGVASVSRPSPILVTGEGLGLVEPFTVVDHAGMTAGLYTPPVNIDRTPPVPNITVPAAGATYGAFSTTAANYSCTDALSGIGSCTGTQAQGANLPTNTSGAKSFTVTATDVAGNVMTLGRSYTVAPLQFERFIEPLRRSPTLNGVTAGSLVPIRWRLLSAGQVVTNPAAFQSFTVLNLTCQGTPVPLNDTATGGAGLTVNPANGYFTYNWQTEASWAGTCRRVQIRLGDNSVREVVFRLN